MSNSYELPKSPIPFLDGHQPLNLDHAHGGEPIVVKKTPNIMGLQQVVVKYALNVAPENFQRPESWSKDDQKAFFISLCMDRVEGVIVIVDVENALYKLQQVAPDDRAISNIYEPILEAGLEYIVLDGNNRLQFLINLINGIYSIPEGRYGYIRDPQDHSISVFTVKRNKNKFSDLPKPVQRTLLNRLIIISEYTQIGYDGLSEVFLNTNSGVFPNAQEIRNALNSPWADYVRSLRSEIPQLLGHMFKNFKKRYCGDDWIVDCLDFVLNVKTDDFNDENEVINTTYSPITQSSKTKLYESDFLSAAEQIRIKDTFIDLASFVDQMIDEKITKEDKKLLKRKALLQNLFYMMYNGLTTYEQVQKAVELHDKAYFDKKNLFYPNWSDADTDKQFDDLTFKNACEGSRSVNMEFRCLQLTKIMSEVMGTELSKAFNL
tara:strand:- start:33 stop:1334 length:1302 start_codon:yes stop_codon:yes gene_type:complete